MTCFQPWGLKQTHTCFWQVRVCKSYRKTNLKQNYTIALKEEALLSFIYFYTRIVTFIKLWPHQGIVLLKDLRKT